MQQRRISWLGFGFVQPAGSTAGMLGMLEYCTANAGFDTDGGISTGIDRTQIRYITVPANTRIMRRSLRLCGMDGLDWIRVAVEAPMTGTLFKVSNLTSPRQRTLMKARYRRQGSKYEVVSV